MNYPQQTTALGQFHPYVYDVDCMGVYLCQFRTNLIVFCGWVNTAISLASSVFIKENWSENLIGSWLGHFVVCKMVVVLFDFKVLVNRANEDTVHIGWSRASALILAGFISTAWLCTSCCLRNLQRHISDVTNNAIMQWFIHCVKYI